jgi:glyoxylase-like metal-dependent hydrolase (beta-lactamase superfamily II)
MRAPGTTTGVVPLRLSLSNAYLLLGERPIIVDAGSTGDESTILEALRRRGHKASEVSLILHTHGHADHAGSTAALRRLTGAPVAAHQRDAAMLASSRNGGFRPTRLLSRLVRRPAGRRFDPVSIDVPVEDGTDLGPSGIAGRVIATSGHTDGSISVLLDSGEAIVGDLLIGGILRGRLFPGRPAYRDVADSSAEVRQGIARILDPGAQRLYVG